MADNRSWLEDLSRRTGASVEESDIERLGQTNPDDLGRLQSALESQYLRRGQSGQAGSGMDSTEATQQGYGSGRNETADDFGGGSRGGGGFGGGNFPVYNPQQPGVSTNQPVIDFSGILGQQQELLKALQQQQSGSQSQLQQFLAAQASQQTAAQTQLQQLMAQQQQRQAADAERRKGYEDQVRQTVMGLMSQKPQTADQIAQSPEARSYQRLQERSQQLNRARSAEQAGAAGTGGVAGTGEVGGALGSAVEGGSRDLAERTYGMQAQLMSKELDARRQQLMQALQLGAGLMSDEQRNQLTTELSQIQNATQQLGMGQSGVMGLLGLGQQGQLGQGQLMAGLLGQQQQGLLGQGRLGLDQELGRGQLGLGQGQLSLGLLNSLLGNEQFYSGLGANVGYQQALLNQSPYQYLF